MPGVPFQFQSGHAGGSRLCAGGGDHFQECGARAHDARFGLVDYLDALDDGGEIGAAALSQTLAGYFSERLHLFLFEFRPCAFGGSGRPFGIGVFPSGRTTASYERSKNCNDRLLFN